MQVIEPSQGLFDLGLAETWKARELLWFLVWRDVKVRYKQTAVGALWAVLQPLLTMAVFTVVFHRLAKVPTSGVPAPVFYLAGLVLWMYFASALHATSECVAENHRLLTKVYFPRLVLPLAAVVPPLVELVIGTSLLLAIALFAGVRPSATAMLLPAFVLLAILAALGAGLWLAALNAVYRDFRYIVPFVVQFGLFVSPVVYPSTLVPARWRSLYGVNPMASAIEGFRWSMSGKAPPAAGMLTASILVSAGLLATGLVYFRRREAMIVDVV